MRIVHASDWHGRLIELPAADLYVFSGDMLPNFPVTERDYGLRLFMIRSEVERVKQLEWLADRSYPHRGMLASPDSPIVCVRGNHDYIDAAVLFPGANVTELLDNESLEIAGKRITGHRGIPWIHGIWNDETHRPDLIDRMKSMPQADIYVTHYPPWGILDHLGPLSRNEHVGLEELAYRLIYRRTPVPSDSDAEPDFNRIHSLHLFGHIHECGGRTEQHGGVLFSNAATTFNVIEF